LNSKSPSNKKMSVLSKMSIVNVWKNADCVCFDVDSTVCRNEAIDDLANYIGVGSQVEKITREAMGGNMTFREALKKRLAIIRPSVSVIDEFNQLQKNQLTPFIKELVEALHAKSVPVYLVSGGFRAIVNPVAESLNIDPQSNVYANTILFDENGKYTGFDEQEPTSESGGKGKVIEKLKETYGYKNVVMIGDGATDLETVPPADAFIGFGGNVVREKVKQGSFWFIHCFQELIEQL